AARCGHNDILTWLIDQEPDMLGATASVKWGLTELHLSAMIGNQEAVHRLIEKQTSTGKRIFGSSEKKDTLGYNSLMYAAKNGVLEIVDVLLEIGDVNTVWKDGYTALHLAVSNGHAKVAALLIKRGANLQAKTSDGYTPLHIACERGFLSIAKICVEGTALKTRVKCMGGNSPIHLAAEYGHAKILAYLVDPMDLGSNGKGQIPVDLLSAAGWTPLHVAAHNFYAEACKTLLGLGASIIAFSVTGDTPLSLAKKTK
ncbi:Ankyrin repeat-containing domain protein, partial [Rhypophila sp. PSN 637]